MFELNKNYNNFGRLMILIGILLLLPLGVLIFYPHEVSYAFDFLLPAAFSITLGFLLVLSSKGKSLEDVYLSSDSNLLVLSAWLYGILIGAIPFITGKQVNTLHALFESVSGWTTTGLSVLDVSLLPKIFLFYRSFMQFCGGLGFILMMTLFIQNKQAMPLYNAEGHPDKLMPNLKKTSQVILFIYSSFMILGVLFYKLAGMSWFDGICHSMCSLSTGGFSTKLNSIGDYSSIPVELITVFLMLIGTTNFAVLMLLFRRKFKQAFRVSEVKFLGGLLLVAVPLTTYSLVSQSQLNLTSGFRIAFFNTISALSTTGYSSVSFNGWPSAGLFIIILLMLIGGGIGSTAGGMKLTRVYLLFRGIRDNLRTRFGTTRAVRSPFYYRAGGKTPIDSATYMDILGFTGAYMLLYFSGVLAMVLTSQHSLTEVMFEFASALGTVGLSVGVTSVSASNAVLVIEMVGMLLGRLEIFIVLFGFSTFLNSIKRFISRIVDRNQLSENES